MRTAIDTNVISALRSGEPASQGMAASLGRAKNQGGLVICAPVYVELLAYPSSSAFPKGPQTSNYDVRATRGAVTQVISTITEPEGPGPASGDGFARRLALQAGSSAKKAEPAGL